MAGKKKNPEQTTATRNTFLEKSFELFAEKTIEPVTMSEIARASGYREMTLYRYFSSKPVLVVAVATWKWENFMEEYMVHLTGQNHGRMTAVERYTFLLDSFLELYRNHPDLLRFNQFFNVYIQADHVDTDTLMPYRKMINTLKERFHRVYLDAEEDHTIRTDVPEDEIFSTTLHLMLAAVTRYAVGLVYDAGNNPEKELKMLKMMLMREYTTQADC